MFDNTRLLVVDDEEVICQACERIFLPHGFRVESSRDPIDGLCLAAEEDFAALLLDIKMAALDGIQFLEQLRKTKPNLPVILITGYPSIQSAASAMRLGAVDYITKPFAPEQITEAVRRALRPSTPDNGDESRCAFTSGVFKQWVPQAQEFHFKNESWFQRGEDGSLRVGALLTRDQGEGLEGVRLPQIGETVYQGLPYAALKTAKKPLQVIPAPASGVVVAVNESLLARPELLATDPCKNGWIACICPTRLENEATCCERRRVVLVSADSGSAGEQTEKLASLGCEVSVVRTWKDLTPYLANPDGTLLVVDAGSLGDRGPEMVRRVNAGAAGMKVVVVASPGSKWEGAYRERKIFYYAVEPFADNEIVDILDAAFRCRRPSRCPAKAGKAAAAPISRISITNGSGRKVRLLAASGLLGEEQGLARRVIHRLRDRLFTVETATGSEEGISPVTILHAAHECHRLLILLEKDMGRLPGSLVRDTLGEFASVLCEHSGNVTTLVVQPPAEDGGRMTFCDDTIEALAEHISREMVLCYQAASEGPKDP